MTSLCLFGSLGEFAVKLKATIDKISSFFALVKGPKVFRQKIGMISCSYQNIKKMIPQSTFDLAFSQLNSDGIGGVPRI